MNYLEISHKSQFAYNVLWFENNGCDTRSTHNLLNNRLDIIFCDADVEVDKQVSKWAIDKGEWGGFIVYHTLNLDRKIFHGEKSHGTHLHRGENIKSSYTQKNSWSCFTH